MAEKMGGQSVPKKNPDEESEDINMEDSVEDEQEITAEEAEGKVEQKPRIDRSVNLVSLEGDKQRTIVFPCREAYAIRMIHDLSTNILPSIRYSLASPQWLVRKPVTILSRYLPKPMLAMTRCCDKVSDNELVYLS